MATRSSLVDSRRGSLDLRLADGEPAVRIHERVWMSEGASNTYLVTADAGDVLINTGLGIEGPLHLRAFEARRKAPIRYVLITQGHVDHVGGIGAFKTAHPDAVVIAQESIEACQADDGRLKGFRQRRNLRFFPEFLKPLAAGAQPTRDGGLGNAQSVARPDVTFAREHRFTLGDVTFELYSVPGGETVDSTLVWLPKERVLFSGNALGPLFPHIPNFYTIRGDRLRFALPYIDAVQKMIDLAPELLVTGHFGPIAGAATIRAELERLRDAVRYLHDRTVEGMNAGKDVFTLMRDVTLPPELEVGEDYGTVPWAVRAIYEGYAGWFQFRSTTELYDRPVHEVYGDIATLAGVDALASAAAKKLANGDALGAVHLAEIALAGDAAHDVALDVYARAHEALLARSHARNRWQKYWLEGEIATARARRGPGSNDAPGETSRAKRG